MSKGMPAFEHRDDGFNKHRDDGLNERGYDGLTEHENDGRTRDRRQPARQSIARQTWVT